MSAATASPFRIELGATLRLALPLALADVPGGGSALSLAEEGAIVVLTGRRREPLESVAARINQTGQAIEVMAITMGIYLGFSLLIAALMNWYNRAAAPAQR